MPEIFVGAGSNAAPACALETAVLELQRQFGALRLSNVYRSPAEGAAAADYLNLVVALTTERDADSVRDVLRAIETLAGRTRRDPAVVELDLDLLLYGSCVDAGRKLPRPGTFTRPFILEPLAELAPALVHPVTGERCEAAWRALRRAGLRDLGPLSAFD
jgi:2-amino-4-hydroxy-6-hydroxymethyldihydropteridine diphosphokinase